MRARALGLCVLAALVLFPGRAHAQLAISGQVDALALGGRDLRGLNRNFRSDSPFSQLRLRLFAQHWVTERIGVFSELLFDIAATEPRVNGAYVVINGLAGQSWLNTRVGMAPSPIGNFGLRDTYFNTNPLVGVPLIWQHRSTLDGSGLIRNEDLMRRRRTNSLGLPMLYLACWNIQWELMGGSGLVDYSLAATSGSFSNMAAMDEEGVAGSVRFGVEPITGVRFGVSGGIGPWIGGPLRDTQILAKTYPGDPEDYLQRVAGYDVEVLYGKLRFFSEGFASDWEVPLVTEKLSAWSGYGEISYDFFAPWQGAVRAGVTKYNEISATNDGLGPQTGWDDDTFQVESALSYRFARELILRADWQHTEFWTGPDDDVDLLALQVRAVF